MHDKKLKFISYSIPYFFVIMIAVDIANGFNLLSEIVLNNIAWILSFPVMLTDAVLFVLNVIENLEDDM